jgi:hypothetical protein
MRPRAIAVVLVSFVAAGAAVQDSLRDALNLGHTRDEALYGAFNRGYQLAASGSVDSAEVITEFRQAVMLVRQRETLGDYIQDPRALSAALAPYAGRVTFVAQARLNPLNTYVKPPAYDLYVSTGPSTKPLAGNPSRRDPVYPPGTGPGLAGPLTGVRVTSTFVRADVEAAAQPSIVLTDDRAEIIWQARIDLSRYREP